MSDNQAKRLARPEFITRDCRHTYDPKERIRLAEDLSHELILRGQATKEFGALKHQFEEKLSKHDHTINSLTRQLCEGWEYRDIKCKVLWNDPHDGEKTIVRLDTGEILAVESMTDDERQEELPLITAEKVEA